MLYKAKKNVMEIFGKANESFWNIYETHPKPGLKRKKMLGWKSNK